MWGALFDERTSLQFTPTIAYGPCQNNHSEAKSHRTHDHILLSHLRLPQPGRPGPRIYIPGQWVPFSLPLATLRATMEVF
jgi:hypothetical protein